MHPHLTLILSSRASTELKDSEEPHLADMSLIGGQAELMQLGVITFNAMKSGDIASILGGLVALAYQSLQFLSALSCKVDDYAAEKTFSYHLVDVMRLLMEKINACSAGDATGYSGLYHVCAHLATDFLNADFDKAFRNFHEWYTSTDSESSSSLFSLQLKLPDLTDCLYE